MDKPEFVYDDWLYVRMDHVVDGEKRARRFFNASPLAKVEQTENGYRVWAKDCHPGAGNDA